jgi:hypothetical protein
VCTLGQRAAARHALGLGSRSGTSATHLDVVAGRAPPAVLLRAAGGWRPPAALLCVGVGPATLCWASASASAPPGSGSSSEQLVGARRSSSLVAPPRPTTSSSRRFTYTGIYTT